MIKIVHHKIPDIKQLNLPTGRLYETPDGNRYPSVSTVLASIPNPYLAEWRAQVGEDTAKKISKTATDRGTKIHAACENYILGKPIKWGLTESVTKEMFTNMIPFLQFDEVHGLESKLWSDRIRCAGTVDCVAIKDGALSIVDFKTSGRYKNREEIDGYFMQTAAYALMWWERTGMMATNLKIIMTTQDDGVLIYNEPVRKWLDRFIEVRKNCEF